MTLPLVLYVLGFLLQVIGGVIVIREIRDDVRTAERIPEHVAYGNIDGFPRFVKERLTGRLRRRIIGVLLIFAGAAVGLGANLAALLR